MPFLKIGESELFYTTQGEGPAIVLAHGVGGNHAIWFRQIDTFARSYQVIAFDHRGFGKSSDVEGLGRSAFASDLRVLLDHLGIERAALVGQSMGAGTCVAFAAQYPDRVSALVIAASLHAIEEPAEVREIMDRVRTETDNLDQLDRVLAPEFRRKNPAEATLYAAIAGFNATTRKSLRGKFAKTVSPAALAETKIPILFIAGMNDIIFPVDAIRRVQAEVPGSFLVEVHDAGHSAFFERPTEFNDSVLSFLQMAGVKGRSRAAHSNSAGYRPVAG